MIISRRALSDTLRADIEAVGVRVLRMQCCDQNLVVREHNDGSELTAAEEKSVRALLNAERARRCDCTRCKGPTFAID